MVVGLLRHLEELFEERYRIVWIGGCGLGGGCVGGSLVLLLEAGEHSVLRALLPPSQDLRHRRTWRLLSIPLSAHGYVRREAVEPTSTFHCDRCSRAIASAGAWSVTAVYVCRASCCESDSWLMSISGAAIMESGGVVVVVRGFVRSSKHVRRRGRGGH